MHWWCCLKLVLVHRLSQTPLGNVYALVAPSQFWHSSSAGGEACPESPLRSADGAMLDNARPQVSFTCRVANQSSRGLHSPCTCHCTCPNCSASLPLKPRLCVLFCMLRSSGQAEPRWQMQWGILWAAGWEWPSPPHLWPAVPWLQLLCWIPPHSTWERSHQCCGAGAAWEPSQPRVQLTQVWVGQAFMFLEPSLAVPSGSTCFHLSIDQESSLIISVPTCNDLKGAKWPEMIWKHE